MRGSETRQRSDEKSDEKKDKGKTHDLTHLMKKVEIFKWLARDEEYEVSVGDNGKAVREPFAVEKISE